MSREAALARALVARERARARPLPVRILLAALGLVMLVAAIPLAVVLPEGGIPLALLSLRLLAGEFVWAARAYAAIAHGWERTRAWYEDLGPAGKGAVLLALLAVGALLVWLAILAF